ncbi:MAG: hypothetical protein ACRCS3_16035 [Paracoccaceae bacterium]
MMVQKADMAPHKTQLVFSAPKIAAMVPAVSIYVMLPWYDRAGPVSLREQFVLDGVLPAGSYRLKGMLAQGVCVDIPFEIVDGAVTTLRLTKAIGFWSLRKLDPKAPMPTLFILRVEEHVAHFWIGHCESNERLGALLSEAAYFALDDDERDKAFISEFSLSQQTRWIDHDFLEAGKSDAGADLNTRFAGHSWVDAWSRPVEQRAKELGIPMPNCFIMLGGAPDKPMDWEIDHPADIIRPGVQLRYAGKIRFTVA